MISGCESMPAGDTVPGMDRFRLLLAQIPTIGGEASSAADPLFEGVDLFGVRLIGFNAENGRKLLLSVALILVAISAAWLLRWIGRRAVSEARHPRSAFWVRQVVTLAASAFGVLGLISIWFDRPERLATALGLLTAGLAFALQRVVTSVAGYFVILRGKLFRVGDRIVMGGVRGDVMTVGMTQTTILEMGQPPAVAGNPPDVWVRSRQYTGRVVNVPNTKVFEEPIYNYSMHVPFIWEEMSVGVGLTADHARAEAILLEAAGRNAVRSSDLSSRDFADLRRKHLDEPALEPKVYWRLTDRSVELTVRFVTPERGVREIKDRMTREVLAGLTDAGIGIATDTLEITGFPPLRLERGEGGDGVSAAAAFTRGRRNG